MSKFIVISVFQVFVLFISLLVVACTEKNVESKVAVVNGESIVGEFVYVEGEVFINGNLASIGDEVIDGDTVKTNADGLAEIEFGDRRVLRTKSDSELVIDNTNHVFNLNKGTLAVVQSRAGALSKNKNWIVQTPTVAAAVRGTVYYTKVEGSDQVYFCLCNGKISLEGGEHKLALEASDHNAAVRFIRDGSDIRYEEAVMDFHTNKEMEDLAGLVDVDIDWNKISSN